MLQAVGGLAFRMPSVAPFLAVAKKISCENDMCQKLSGKTFLRPGHAWNLGVTRTPLTIGQNPAPWHVWKLCDIFT